MWPIGYRRIARTVSTVILLVAPAAKGNTVTVDLGTIAATIGVNASIMNSDFPLDTETYTYQQLLFAPSDLVFDNGQTLEEVLAQDLGNANQGTLDYNFPFSFGASGSYSQNAIIEPFGTADPGTLSLTATTFSGTGCPGIDTVGSTINVDPIFAATTYDTILGCDSLASLVNNIPTATVTTATLPPLGTITSNGTTTVYIGEVIDTEWTISGEVGPATSGVPEPASLSLVAAGIAALGWIRVRRRSRRPA